MVLFFNNKSAGGFTGIHRIMTFARRKILIKMQKTRRTIYCNKVKKVNLRPPLTYAHILTNNSWEAQ